MRPRKLRVVIAPSHPHCDVFRPAANAPTPTPGCPHSRKGSADRCSQCQIDPRFVTRYEAGPVDRPVALVPVRRRWG